VLRSFDAVRTERLLMRRWREDDREPFAAMNADPEVMRYFPAPLDRAASDALVDRIEDLFGRQGFGLWALEVAGPEPASTEPAGTEPAGTEPAGTEPAGTEPAGTEPAGTEPAGTGEFIGFTGLNPMPPGVPGAGGLEVGWRLARHAWHHGYATEAAVAAVGVAFEGAGVAEIWSMTAAANVPSQAVMRRLGMTLHTRFDHPAIEAGHPLRPHVAYRLARSSQSASQSGWQSAPRHGSPHRSRVGTSVPSQHIPSENQEISR
jgi:RimJ/RimL family protein N-acetyltransferase